MPARHHRLHGAGRGTHDPRHGKLVSSAATALYSGGECTCVRRRPAPLPFSAFFSVPPLIVKQVRECRIQPVFEIFDLWQHSAAAEYEAA